MKHEEIEQIIFAPDAASGHIFSLSNGAIIDIVVNKDAYHKDYVNLIAAAPTMYQQLSAQCLALSAMIELIDGVLFAAPADTVAGLMVFRANFEKMLDSAMNVQCLAQNGIDKLYQEQLMKDSSQ